MSVHEDAEAAATAAIVHAVAVKLPEFWTYDPGMWFFQAEAIFRRSNVTRSHTKFDHVVIKLPETVLLGVRDILMSVTAETEDPYSIIKTRLMERFGHSKWHRLNQLLDYPDLAPGAKPSALMDGMLALLPEGEKPTDLFLAGFLRRLPIHLREQLGAVKFETPRAMAVQADLLWDARGGAAATAATDAVNAVSRSPQRNRSPSVPGRSRRQTPASRSLCYYHQRFGDQATRCKNPCSFQGNDLAASST